MFSTLVDVQARADFPAIALRSEAMLLAVVPSARTLARRVTSDAGSRT